MADRDLQKLLGRMEQLRGERAELRDTRTAAQRLAAEKCAREKRDTRAVNAANLNATKQRGVLRWRATERRCAIRRSHISRETRHADHELARAERKTRRELEAAEVEAGSRPAKGAKERRPIVDPRTGKRFTADQMGQELAHARDHLRENASSPGAALYWFTRAEGLTQLRALSDRMRRRGSSRFDFPNHVLEAFEENASNLTAAWADHEDGPGAVERERVRRRNERAQQREVDRGTRILDGAALPAPDAARRVRAALVARGHEPEIRGRRVRCEQCGGAGALRRTSSGALSLAADEVLRAQRCEPLPF